MFGEEELIDIENIDDSPDSEKSEDMEIETTDESDSSESDSSSSSSENEENVRLEGYIGTEYLRSVLSQFELKKNKYIKKAVVQEKYEGVTTNKGTACFDIEGNIFVPSTRRISDNTLIARCIVRGCRTQLEVRLDDTHYLVECKCYHLPQPEKVEVSKALSMAKLNRQSGVSSKKCVQVMLDNVGETSKAVILSNKRAMRRRVQRSVEVSGVGKEFPLHIDWQKLDYQGETAKMFDSSNDPSELNPITVFSHPSVREHIQNAKHVYGDGSFITKKSTGKYFMQVYVVATKINGKSLPLAYALLSGKKQADYRKLFDVLSGVGLKPDVISLDFEIGASKAAEAVWPQATIHYCYIHFTRALKRKLKKHNLITNDPNGLQLTREMMVLPFLKEDDLLEVVDSFSERAKETTPVFASNYSKFHKYLIKMYTGGFSNHNNALVWKHPVFEVSRWNSRLLLSKGLDVTNNTAESIFHVVNGVLTPRQKLFAQVVVTDLLREQHTICEEVKNMIGIMKEHTEVALFRDPKVIDLITEDYDNPFEFLGRMVSYMNSRYSN